MARRYGGGRSRGGGRLVIVLVIAGISFLSYFATRSVNPVTGKAQYVALSVDQEVVLGLQSAPELAQQFGGLHPDASAQATVDRVGERLLSRGFKGESVPYPFEFHLLADPETVNAFALPGGQIFITAALFTRLETEGQLAGVLAHEIGHVVERHGAEHLAKANLTQGLVGAVAVGATDTAVSPQQAAAVAAAIGQVINMKYGRDDELESDQWGLTLMARAGYDPRAMERVMQILAESSGGRGGQPEFFSTHPNPENRIERIRKAIETMFPNGVPDSLEK